VSGSWVPSCAICELLNTGSSVVPATTELHGVAICLRHLREVHGSDTSKAARAVQRLAFKK
jgi:hypothetical protein